VPRHLAIRCGCAPAARALAARAAITAATEADLDEFIRSALSLPGQAFDVERDVWRQALTASGWYAPGGGADDK
jgi:hypothetical protein